MKLKNISNNGVFSLLDLSRVNTLVKKMKLDLSTLEDQSLLNLILDTLMEYLSPEVSGVVIDPVINFNSLLKKSSSTGLLLPLEQINEDIDPLSLPNISSTWGIEQIRNNYGVVKLELYYNPQEPEALKKKQLLAEVYDYCQYEGLDLVLELMIYQLGEKKVSKEEMLESQLQSISEFTGNFDVLALEFLGDALSAVTVTASLDVPWIYKAKDVVYSQFKENLRICMESGAVGFLAGETFLDTLDENIKTKEEIQKVVTTELRDRVIESVRIINEAKALI